MIILLKDVEVRWAHVQKPKLKYQSKDTEYSIDVKLDKEKLAEFYVQGLSKLKNVEDGWVSFKKPTVSKSGDLFKKPPVVDIYGDDFDKLVGNGSKCNIRIKTFDSDVGTCFWLDGVQVVEVVEFNAETDKLEGFDIRKKEEAPFDTSEHF